jgi:hypothetical protein
VPTKINKNLENSFVFAPNEMQQVAFEGAKQNECLEDGAEGYSLEDAPLALQDGRRHTGRFAVDRAEPWRSASPVDGRSDEG